MTKLKQKMNDISHLGQLLRAGQYEQVLSLLNQHYPNSLPTTELVKVASFCEVNLGLFQNAIRRLVTACEASPKDNGLIISLCFAYAKQGDLSAAERHLKVDIDFVTLSPQEYNELIFLINSFALSKVTVKMALDQLGKKFQSGAATNEAIEGLHQLLDIAKQKQVWSHALSFAKKLHQLTNKNNYIIDQAIALRFLNRPGEGIPLLTGLASKMQHFAIYHNLANLYSDMGRLDTALTCYEKAIALNPDYVESLVNHAKVAFELGQSKSWLNTFEQVLARQQPTNPNARHHSIAYINLLIESESYEQAISYIASKANLLTPPIAALLKAKCLRLQNKPEAAYDVLKHYHNQGVNEINQELLEISLTLQDITEATQYIHALEPAVKHNAPLGQILKANTYILDRLSQRPLETSVKDTVWEHSADDSDVVLADIEKHMTTLHASLSTPVNQSVRQGTQTRGNLFPSTQPALEALERFIKAQIQKYILKNTGCLGVNSEALTSADCIEFTGSWSVLNKYDGYHVPHYHSNGLVSGVFYIDVPDGLDDKVTAGHLHIGKVDKAPFYSLEPFITVKPEKGKLVLFPSHLWHGTFPTEREGNRLTIAFDAIVV